MPPVCDIWSIFQDTGPGKVATLPVAETTFKVVANSAVTNMSIFTRATRSIERYLLRQRGWLAGWLGGLAGWLSHAGIVSKRNLNLS